jgi:hypothetical protein
MANRWSFGVFFTGYYPKTLEIPVFYYRSFGHFDNLYIIFFFGDCEKAHIDNQLRNI